jgi:hypothetical protein
MCGFDSGSGNPEFALKKLKCRFDLTWVWKAPRSIQCLCSDRLLYVGDVRHDDDIKLGRGTRRVQGKSNPGMTKSIHSEAHVENSMSHVISVPMHKSCMNMSRHGILGRTVYQARVLNVVSSHCKDTGLKVNKFHVAVCS